MDTELDLEKHLFDEKLDHMIKSNRKENEKRAEIARAEAAKKAKK